MIAFNTLPARLKAAEADYQAARKPYDEARARFDADKAELAHLQDKRESLSDSIDDAKGEADAHRRAWKDCIKGATTAFLADKSAGLSSDIGDARLSAKMAEARAEEQAAILAEIDDMIAAQRGKCAKAANALARAHRVASLAYARRENLKAMLATFPVLRRAQAIAVACDASGEEVSPKYMDLPLGMDGPDEAELTDGMGNRYAVENLAGYYA